MRTLPPRTLEQVITAFPSYRQSILQTADNCALSTRFDLEGHGYTNAAQARGIIFHRFAAAYLETLRQTGETTMPTEEALVILYEVSRQREVEPEQVVVVPARERRLLRMAALALASMPLDMSRLIDVERRLEAPLRYQSPDGCMVERVVSGTLDALLADPPASVIVLDWKTAQSAPAPVPVDEAGNEIAPHWTGDHLHVSPEGYFQQRAYAFLVMRNFPSVQQVTLREYYPLPKESRNAHVPRAALEHIEHELGVLVGFLDRALQGGSESPLWAPSPGLHCGWCRRPSTCPIEWEARAAEGGITSDIEAACVAGEVAVASVVRDEGIKAMKSYHEATGRPIPVRNAKGRSEWRWGKDAAGKRRFKMHTPEHNVKDDPQLAEAFAEAAQEVDEWREEHPSQTSKATG